MTPPASAPESAWTSALVAPSVRPVLDPHFRPASLAWRRYQQHARDSGSPVQVRFALEQQDGGVTCFTADLLLDGHALVQASRR